VAAAPGGTGTRRRCAIAFVLCLLATCCFSATASAGIYWSWPATIDSTSLLGLSCPSESLCVGVDWNGNVLASTDPTGGASTWSTATISGEALNDVSCAPSGAVCVAVSEHSTYTSTDPTGGPSAWKQVAGAAGGERVDCPTASLCAAVEYHEVRSTTEPAETSTAWHSTDIGQALTDISCTAESLCVTVGESITTFPNVVTDPGTYVQRTVSSPLSRVSCPTTTFCASVGTETAAFTTNPAGGAWTVATSIKALANPYALSCASAQLCAVVGENGEADDTETLTSSPAAWTKIEGIDGTQSIDAVSCPSESLCLAADEALMIGTPSHTLSVSINEPKRGEVTSSPIACPFGCTYSGPVCPHDCGASNAFIPQRLAEVVCGANPIGLDPGLCSLEYPYQDTVTLVAQPVPGNAFVGWGGACAGKSDCAAQMSADRTVTATFVALKALPRHPARLTIGGVHQSNGRWREGRSLPRALAARTGSAAPVGTDFDFALSLAATVTLRFERELPARHCVHHHRCSARRGVGEITLAAGQGDDRIHFAGRLSHHRRLPVGDYRVRLTAASSGEHTPPRYLDFAIVP
jgi:Divergent InlB B-repeat domain